MKRRGGNKAAAKLGGNGGDRADRVDSDRNLKKTMTTTTTKKVKLMKYESLPEYLKDNEYILDHYRCEWPLKETVLSIFSWHNETLNIWTHLLGFLVFAGLMIVSTMETTKVEGLVAAFFRPALRTPLMMMTMKTETNGSDSLLPEVRLRKILHPSVLDVNDYEDPNPIPRWPWFVFLTGAMGCLICSSLSHLFACHSKRFNLFFWRLDYAGISLMIVCSFFAPIYYAFSCNPWPRLFYLASITFLGILAIVTLLAPALSSSKYRSFRASLFLTMGFSGVIPAAHSVALHWGHPLILVAVEYELIMSVSYAVGAAIYMSRIPERWKPGAFDIAGHSHQIFHVFVVAGAIAHCAATLVIMDWRRSSPACDGGDQTIFGWL